jgi:hypothetical protein
MLREGNGPPHGGPRPTRAGHASGLAPNAEAHAVSSPRSSLFLAPGWPRQPTGPVPFLFALRIALQLSPLQRLTRDLFEGL